MPDEVESMGYRMRSSRDVPWHTLGNPIEHDATVDEMLNVSSLAWTVSKRPLWTPAAVSMEWVEGDKAMTVPDYYALVRDNDNKILGISGPDYIPTQNKQAFNFFKKFTEAGHMAMETAGSLQGGKQIWVLAKLMMKFTLPGGDEVHGYLLLSSPHIWGKSLVIKFVTIRVVCMNTFTMAMNESKYGRGFRMPHVRDFDGVAIKEAETSLGIAEELFAGFEQTAHKLAKAKVNLDLTIRYIADIFQPELIEEQFGKGFYKQPELEQARLIAADDSPKIESRQLKRTGYDVYNCLERQPGASLESSKETMWGAVNAILYYSDFRAGRDRDNALYSAWFGPKAATKSQAMRRALQIADVL